MHTGTKVKSSKIKSRFSTHLISLCIILSLFAQPGYSQSVSEWIKTIGNSYRDEPFGIIEGDSKSFYLAGSFSGSLDVDPGPQTKILKTSSPDNRYIYISKFDSVANLIWAKQIGGPGTSYVWGKMYNDQEKNLTRN